MCPGVSKPTPNSMIGRRNHRTLHAAVFTAVIYYRERSQIKISKETRHTGFSLQETRPKLP